MSLNSTQQDEVNQAIKKIADLNKFNLRPIVSPIISGISNFPSVECAPFAGGSGRYCGTGYIDIYNSSIEECRKEEEEEPFGQGEGGGEGGDSETPPTPTYTIIQNRFRWGYNAEA
jgi:hypothetical protein